jgi:hypothetical protein
MLTHNHTVGAANESIVMAYLASQRLEVFTPIYGFGRCDFIYLRTTGEPVRVQVKSSSWAQNSQYKYEQCSLRTGPGKFTSYQPNEIDEIWVVGTHLWNFPLDSISEVSVLSLHTDNPNPRKTYRNYNPNDFIIVGGSIDFPFKGRLSFIDPNPDIMVHNDQYSYLSAKVMKYRKTSK